ncbi:hypothetical protein [Arhodomonas sp. AD133]|uniref:hypothetical protein n=1 Tax=Arhodomonas sp. AD133 TaxID=3415009 RepID=UPI003EB83755
MPYLGDLMFWWIIQPLCRTDSPALRITGGEEAEWPQRELNLTATGAAVLDGEHHWLDFSPLERWIGGVRIAGEEGGTWCLDRGAGRLFRR